MTRINHSNYTNINNEIQNRLDISANKKVAFTSETQDKFVNTQKQPENNDLSKKILIGTGLIVGIGLATYSILKGKKADAEEVKNVIKNITSETVEKLEDSNIFDFFEKDNIKTLFHSDASNIRMVLNPANSNSQKTMSEMNVELSKLTGYDPNAKNHLITCIFNQEQRKILHTHVFNYNNADLSPKLKEILDTKSMICLED